MNQGLPSGKVLNYGVGGVLPSKVFGRHSAFQQTKKMAGTIRFLAERYVNLPLYHYYRRNFHSVVGLKAKSCQFWYGKT